MKRRAERNDATNRSSDKSISQGAEKKSDEKQKPPLEAKQVVHMKDKTIYNNRRFMQVRNQKRLNETFNTLSHMGIAGYKNQSRSKNSGNGTPKNSDMETPKNIYENDMTDMNNHNYEDGFEKQSNNNFEVSQNFDEVSEFQELKMFKKQPPKKSETYNMPVKSSPKSSYSERMDHKISISDVPENEEFPLQRFQNQNKPLQHKRITKSKTGIEVPSPPKKSLSNTSSYKQGETFMRAGEHEEFCGICMQSFENHSPDFNIDLLYLQNKYGDMLNQVTQFDTISRPVTANSMYSMISKKPQVKDDETSPMLRPLPESKYGNLLDTAQGQAGSTWNVPPPPKKSHIGRNADVEYIAKVEKVKLEHYNM